ncbi:MAG: hypothetical protein ACEQSF_05650 [Solirubrobacteraceae bacterium]
MSKSVNAMAIYPFIFLKNSNQIDNKELINHEIIHFQQQKELLFFFFYIWYLLEFLFKLLKFKNSHKAYFNISFEREAYVNQMDLAYLKKRKFWSFFKYI